MYRPSMFVILNTNKDFDSYICQVRLADLTWQQSFIITFRSTYPGVQGEALVSPVKLYEIFFCMFMCAFFWSLGPLLFIRL